LEESFLTLSDSKSGISAEVSTLGAKLTKLNFGDIQTIAPTPISPEQMYFGAVVAPWPNRCANGTWIDQTGVKRHLPINELGKNNALHGLVYNQNFSVLSDSKTHVVLEKIIEPTDGYPYNLSLQISYRLENGGLTASFTARNDSVQNAPFGIAFHPYFQFSKFDTAELAVFSSARKYYEQDLFQIPTDLIVVDGSSKDLRAGKKVAGAHLDDFYTDLEFEKGIATTFLKGPDGSGIKIWQQAIFKHLVIFTTDDYPTETGFISGIAIEPSTCEPNALNRREDLIWIEPEQSVSGSFGVGLI
jgi:aldose 1-epimerase